MSSVDVESRQELEGDKGFLQTKQGKIIIGVVLLLSGLGIFGTVGYQQGWFSDDMKPVTPNKDKSDKKDVTGDSTRIIDGKNPPKDGSEDSDPLPDSGIAGDTKNKPISQQGNTDTPVPSHPPGSTPQGATNNLPDTSPPKGTTPPGSTTPQGPTTPPGPATQPPASSPPKNLIPLPEALSENLFKDLVVELLNNPNADFATLQGKPYIQLFTHKDALNSLRQVITVEPSLRGRIVNLIQDISSTDLPNILEPFDCEIPNYSKITWASMSKLSANLPRIDCLNLKRKSDGGFWNSSEVLEIVKNSIEKLKAGLNNRPTANIGEKLKEVDKAMRDAYMNSQFETIDFKNLGDLPSLYNEARTINSSLMPLVDYAVPIWEAALFEEFLNDVVNKKNSKANTIARSIFGCIIRLVSVKKDLVLLFKYDEKLPYETFLEQFPLCPTQGPNLKPKESASLPNVVTDLNQNPTAGIHELHGRAYMARLMSPKEVQTVAVLITSHPHLRGRITNLISDYSCIYGEKMSLVSILTPHVPSILPPLSIEEVIYLSKKISRVDCLKVAGKDGSIWTAEDVISIINGGLIEALYKDLEEPLLTKLSTFQHKADEVFTSSDKVAAINELKAPFDELKEDFPALMEGDINKYLSTKWELALYEAQISGNDACARSIYASICALEHKTVVNYHKYGAKLPYDNFFAQFKPCAPPAAAPKASETTQENVVDKSKSGPEIPKGDETSPAPKKDETGATGVKGGVPLFPLCPREGLNLSSGVTLDDLILDLKNNTEADIHDLSSQEYFNILMSMKENEITSVMNIIKANPQFRARITNLISDYSSLKSQNSPLFNILTPFDSPNPDYGAISWKTLHVLAKKVSRIDFLRLKHTNGTNWTSAEVKDLISKCRQALNAKIIDPSHQNMMKDFETKADAMLEAADKKAALNDLKAPFEELLKQQHPEVKEANIGRYLSARWEILPEMLVDADPANEAKVKNLYNSLCALENSGLVNVHKYNSEVPFEEFKQLFRPNVTSSPAPKPSTATVDGDKPKEGEAAKAPASDEKLVDETKAPAIANSPKPDSPPDVFEELIADLKKDSAASYASLKEKEYIKYITNSGAFQKLKELVKKNTNLRGRIVNLIQDSVSGRIPEILAKFDSKNPDYSKITWEELFDLSKKIMRIDYLNIQRSDNTLWTSTAVLEIIRKASEELQRPIKGYVRAVESEMDNLDVLDDQRKNFSELNSSYVELKPLINVDLAKFVIPKWEVKLFKELAQDASKKRDSSKNLAAKRIFYSIRSLPSKPLVFQLKYDNDLTFEEFIAQFPLSPSIAMLASI